MNEVILGTRKHNKEVYTFIGYDIQCYTKTGETYYSKGIKVETPANCFGYPDFIFFDDNFTYGYTLYRYLPRNIINRLLVQAKAIYNKWIDSILEEGVNECPADLTGVCPFSGDCTICPYN